MSKNKKNKKIKNKKIKIKKINTKIVNSKKNNLFEIKFKIYWNYFKRFWNFIWYDDSLLSYVANIIFVIFFLKLIFFPGIGLLLNNNYPIVAIVSGSMEHKIVDHHICDKYILDVKSSKLDFDNWWKTCGDYYVKNFNISKDKFKNFKYTNGLNIGDVMVLYGKSPKDINIGDIIVFIPENKQFFESKGPVIHRVVKKYLDKNGIYHFQTKGDHNPESFKNFETDIHGDDIIGVPILRIPYIGYVKLMIYNLFGG